MNPCSSRSRSPLAVRLTVAQQPCPRPESSNSLLQIGFSTAHPQNQPVTTGVYPHLSPFTCWQCYLLCRVVPLECSQTTTPIVSNFTRANRFDSLSEPKLSPQRAVVKESDAVYLPVASEEAAFDFTAPNKTNSSVAFIQSDKPWQAREHPFELPLRNCQN